MCKNRMSAHKSKSKSKSPAKVSSPKTLHDIPNDVLITLMTSMRMDDVNSLIATDKSMANVFKKNKDIIYRERIEKEYKFTPTFEMMYKIMKYTSFDPKHVDAVRNATFACGSPEENKARIVKLFDDFNKKKGTDRFRAFLAFLELVNDCLSHSVKLFPVELEHNAFMIGVLNKLNDVEKQYESIRTKLSPYDRARWEIVSFKIKERLSP